MYEARLQNDGFAKRLFLIDRDNRAGNVVTLEATFHTIEAGLLIPSCFDFHEPEHEQMFHAICEAFWEAGWRPKGLHESDEGQKRHLNDMRAIAFHSMKMKDPEHGR